MQVKKKSQKQEKSVAKDLNAHTVIASGALWGSKGDVRHDNLLVECKTTEKDFYSVTMSVWNKIEREAVKDGLRVPIMCIDLKDGKERYAVFLAKDFEHYKSYSEVTVMYDLSWSDKKSFRVTCPERVLMVNFRRKSMGESPCFIIIPWEDFLYMLRNGEKS